MDRFLFADIALLFIVFLSGYMIGNYFSTQTVYVYNNTKTLFSAQPVLLTETNISFDSIRVPAVDQNGRGVITSLSLQVVPGFGRTLTNIDTLLFWVDTQNSIRIAKSVAERKTGIDLSKFDLIYTINANASVIEGESAGGALTVLTIALLENKTINPEVMMTGTIKNDGTIGPIGEVAAKANAAKEAGIKIFLVPATQSFQITYETKRNCERIGPTEFCTTETIPIRLNVSEEAGLEVIEVNDINDALKYFLV